MPAVVEAARSRSQSTAVGSTDAPVAGADDDAAVAGLPRRAAVVAAEQLAVLAGQRRPRGEQPPGVAAGHRGAGVDLHALGVGDQVRLVAVGDRDLARDRGRGGAGDRGGGDDAAAAAIAARAGASCQPTLWPTVIRYSAYICRLPSVATLWRSASASISARHSLPAALAAETLARLDRRAVAVSMNDDPRLGRRRSATGCGRAANSSTTPVASNRRRTWLLVAPLRRRRGERRRGGQVAAHDLEQLADQALGRPVDEADAPAGTADAGELVRDDLVARGELHPEDREHAVEDASSNGQRLGVALDPVDGDVVGSARARAAIEAARGSGRAR